MNDDLSAKTHVRVSLAQAITLATVVASGAIAWWSVKTAGEQHAANPYVHLDPKFTSEHGLPVGKWDLAGRDDAAVASFKALQAQVDSLKAAQAALEDEVSNRKPRWRP